MSTRLSITGVIAAFLLVVAIVVGSLALFALVLSWAVTLIAPAFGSTFVLTFWPAFGIVVLLYLVGRLLNIGGGKKS